MDIHVFPIPIPPPTYLSTRSLWVFPVHQVRALVSCIQLIFIWLYFKSRIFPKNLLYYENLAQGSEPRGLEIEQGCSSEVGSICPQ